MYRNSRLARLRRPPAAAAAMPSRATTAGRARKLAGVTGLNANIPSGCCRRPKAGDHDRITDNDLHASRSARCPGEGVGGLAATGRRGYAVQRPPGAFSIAIYATGAQSAHPKPADQLAASSIAQWTQGRIAARAFAAAGWVHRARLPHCPSAHGCRLRSRRGASPGHRQRTPRALAPSSMT